MKFGMPYMGSKNSIAAWIVNQLPPAEHFYDVFGGGGAITHAAVLSGKYKTVHYNELNPLVCKGFDMAVNGKFKDETRWISREDFFRLRDSDPYAAICFSFGNNLRDYLYGKDIEDYKRSLHFLIFEDQRAGFEKYFDLSEFHFSSRTNLDRRYTEIKNFVKKQIKREPGQVEHIARLKRLIQLQGLEGLMRLQGLEGLMRLQGLEGLRVTCGSYDTFKFEPDSIVYCDPPYENTRTYEGNREIPFNTDKFLNWAKIQTVPVFISERKEINGGGFCKFAEKDKVSLLDFKADERVKFTEKLYCNRADFHPSGFLF
jgi:hypothetical protein